MNIEIWEEGEIIVARLRGDINSHSAPTLQAELLPLARNDARVVLDMSGVTFVSSAGLRLLLYLNREMTKCQSCIVLTGLSENVRDTMSVTGFLEFFDVFATIDEGLAALRQRQLQE